MEPITEPVGRTSGMRLTIQTAIAQVVAIAQTQLEAVFNNCGLPDLDIAASLSVLFKRGYLEALAPHDEDRI